MNHVAAPRALSNSASPRAAARLGAALGLLMLLSACANLSLPSLPSLFGSLAPAVPAAAGRALQWGDAPDAAMRANDAAPRAADPAYRIGAEDGLEIAVWRDDTLKSTVIVRPDGGISFPLAGDFIVAGMTAAEVRGELVKRLTRFVPDPVVTVTVVRVASYRIYVLGRVNKPGDFAVGRTIDVLQALSLAGGMTPFADEDGIRIIRRVNGRSQAIPFQYSRVRKGNDMSQNIPLQSGDLLLVP